MQADLVVVAAILLPEAQEVQAAEAGQLAVSVGPEEEDPAGLAVLAALANRSEAQVARAVLPGLAAVATADPEALGPT